MSSMMEAMTGKKKSEPFAQYRQGDLLFRKRNPPMHDWQRKDGAGAGEILLAEGEKTGHKHVATAAVEVKRFENTITLWVPDKAEVVHEEHDTIELDEGYWEVIQQRQFDHEAEERESQTQSRARFD